MANETNNAEEQLKQYAEERRQIAPREIHAATRNLLQGEVRRTYGNPEGRRAVFRWRWLQALAWIAILAAIPLFLMPRNPPAKNKLQEATPATSDDVKLPSANVPGEAAIVLSDTKEPVKPPLDEVQARKDSSTATKVKLRDEAKTAVANRGAQMQRQIDAPTAPEAVKKEREELVVSAAKATAPPASAMTGAAASMPVATTAPNNFTVNFANTIPNQPILNTFKFEQNGARLKFSEKDGSVYAGRLLSQQSGTDAFQVAGMNRTLNKATIITGQVVRASLTNVSNLAQQQQAATSNTRSFDSNSNVANNSAINNATANNNYYNHFDNNLRVQGAAQIGNTQYKLDAQQTPGP